MGETRFRPAPYRFASSSPGARPLRTELRYLYTPAALAALWWLLSENGPSAWLIGVPAVAAATWSAWSLATARRSSICIRGLLRFLPLFVWESLQGGIDVARRTLSRDMDIKPGFTSYRTSLEQVSARVFFVNCVCLLPGTLAADLQDDRIDVHTLDIESDTEAEFRRLERAVARVYCEETCAGSGVTR